MMQLREYLPLLVRSVHHQSQCDKTDVPSRACVSCNSFTPPMLEEFCDWISRAKLEPDREVTERLDAGMTAIAGENITLPTSSVRWLWQAILARIRLLDVIDAKLMPSPTTFQLSLDDLQEIERNASDHYCLPAVWQVLLDFLHQIYEGASSATSGVKHPVAPIIRAWLERPIPVEPEQRIGIMPGSLAQVSGDDRRAGRLFNIAAHKQTDVNGDQRVLPGFVNERRGPALPIELYKAGLDLNDPNALKARGAPFLMRTIVDAVLLSPIGQRTARHGVVFSVQARYFLNRMYPARIPAKSTWQRALKEAMEELPRVTMPFIDFDTGRGQTIAPVLIQAVPNTLDDNIDFIVRLPSGNDSGPTPSENLHIYGAMRKQAYYALLNLAYDWWEPGRKRIPVNSNGKRHWLQSYAPERYKPVTNDDVIDLTAPLTANRNRRDAASKGWTTLKRLHDAGELQIVEYKGDRLILPPPPPSEIRQ